MAYEMVMPYHLHMPSYFLETFTEYPYAGKLHKGDKIVFNIRTYKEGMTSRIFYF